MNVKSINYSEGDCFVLPLRNGRFARGVVARLNRKGIVLGYFFGPALPVKSRAALDLSLRPDNAALVGLFGDLGLLKAEWRIIGRIEPWSRVVWRVPPFLRANEDTGRGFLVYYNEDTLDCAQEVKIGSANVDTSGFPEDALWGYGAVEIRLTRLLEKKAG